MLKALFFSALLGLPLSSFASVNTELCALESLIELKQNFAFKTSFDIKKDQKITEFQLRLVNAYFAKDGITARSLEELQSIYAEKGTDENNDLRIIDYSSLTTGRSYSEVVTFPGENPISIIFDASTGQAVAYNNDGTVSIKTAQGEIPCYEIAE